MLSLQRSVGNRAVLSLLRDSAVRAALSPERAIQRAPDRKALAAASDQAKGSMLLAAGLRGTQLVIAVLRAIGFRVGGLTWPIGMDAQGERIDAHLVPGSISDVAVVVAGVHGSERSGVEVADRLLAQLAVHQPYYTVVVVPRLFPSNVATRKAWEETLAKEQEQVFLDKLREKRKGDGDVGRMTPGQVDPNRQFPDRRQGLDTSKPLDSQGRIIEPANMALLSIIEMFQPKRLVSIHAIKNESTSLGPRAGREAGVYADPHPTAVTDATEAALGDEADELAIRMAKRSKSLGANVAGNERLGGWTSLYPGQDPTLSPAQIERENKKGRSLGQWGPSRGVAVITVEVDEQYASRSVEGNRRAQELEAHATSIREIFLGPAPASPSGAATPGSSAPVQRSQSATRSVE